VRLELELRRSGPEKSTLLHGLIDHSLERSQDLLEGARYRQTETGTHCRGNVSDTRVAGTSARSPKVTDQAADRRRYCLETIVKKFCCTFADDVKIHRHHPW
jgi:hypothetical protein